MTEIRMNELSCSKIDFFDSDLVADCIKFFWGVSELCEQLKMLP